jgi:hypothetical protein
MWFIVAFLFLQRFQLSLFDVRPFLAGILTVPPLYLNIFLSFCVSVLAGCLSTPLLFEMLAFKSSTSIDSALYEMKFVLDCYIAHSRTWRRTISFVHKFSGVLPMLMYAILRFVNNLDWLVITVFCAGELAMAIFRLWTVHSKVQFCYYSGLKPVNDFWKKRSFKNGKLAQAALDRSLMMIPVTGMSLSVQPMLVISGVVAVLASLVIGGINGVLVRQCGLFVVGMCDVVMVGVRVVGLFIDSE